MYKDSLRQGPTQSITCTPPHGRPVFSLAVGSTSFVTGSADHGLREYKLDTGKYIRQLFNKKCGHKQWVSTCAYLPNGKILSGAMDSVVCYWDAKAVKCDHFMGHKGPISKVQGNDSLGISAGYDATVMLWDLKKKDLTQKLIGPHKQAIMEFQWHKSLISTGDKSGVMAMWDLNECKLVKAIQSHKGAISNIRIHQKQKIIITTGLNDGTICGFDMRTNCPIFRKMIHTGSVNDIKIIEGKNYFATCSADGTIKILNLPDFDVALTIKAGDMIFCLEETQNIVFAGGAKGNLLAYDIFSGQNLYGYGVMKNGGCRNLKFNEDKNRLVCAGQDDSATLLKF